MLWIPKCSNNPENSTNMSPVCVPFGQSDFWPFYTFYIGHQATVLCRDNTILENQAFKNNDEIRCWIFTLSSGHPNIRKIRSELPFKIMIGKARVIKTISHASRKIWNKKINLYFFSNMDYINFYFRFIIADELKQFLKVWGYL
jgi:hypothetical protein